MTDKLRARASHQALAVPATPANAVDGPSGFDPSRIAAQLAHIIREEQVRQYRGDERGKCPGGASFYEEHVGPYQIALVVLKSFKGASAGTNLAERLRAAARNVELARERASVGYLAGWEHLAMEEAAIAMEARSGETEGLDPKDDSAAAKAASPRLHRLNTPLHNLPNCPLLGLVGKA